jgi:tetratricopeptide (TPR) repeat protein/regulation of enolase protein 1 (concanavalin A-like superfamily)
VYRPEREHKCWRLGTIAAQKCAERYTEISLRELSAGQSRRLIEALLSIDNLPPSVKEAILQKSGGNPFFVEEVVRSLIASGMVYQEGEVWRAREGIEKATVPESIQGVILSRVDRLEQNLKRVLQSAAVIGRLFRRRLLEHTAREATALERDLWELEEQALIYQERAVPEEEYSFKHVLTQETIYQNILRPRRAVFHHQVAESIEALYQDGLEEYYEQLAYHYERSGVDEKAVEYLLKAGEKAHRGYLNEEAISYFQRALERMDRSMRGEARTPGDRPPGSMDAPHPSSGLRRLEALKAVGQIYHGVGKQSEAEVYFRQAIGLGKEIHLAPRELIRLYWWLGDSLHWQGRPHEATPLAEEGLSLLGQDLESVEAALMNTVLARNDRTARFIGRLPYTEELQSAYVNVFNWLIGEKRVSDAMECVQALQRNADPHDLRAAARVHDLTGRVLWSTGDLRGAILRHQEAVEILTRIGDRKHAGLCLMFLGFHSLQLGDLPQVERYLSEALEISEEIQSRVLIAAQQREVGVTWLCQGRSQEALTALRRAAELGREMGFEGHLRGLGLPLGQAHLVCEQREEALTPLLEAAAFVKTDTPLLAAALAGLEEAYESSEAFRGFCYQFREENPEVSNTPFTRWFLEPGEPGFGFRISDFGLPTSEHEIQNPNAQRAPEIQNENWVWHDPFADSSFRAPGTRLRVGLEIDAANARDLWHVNLSAPRLLRPASGDFAAQTVSTPVSAEKPAIGGLLLWKDQENYLRLDRGSRGRHEISFQGCLGNKDAIFGRGRLVTERIFLRLERVDGRVKALCSADGEEWFTVGQVEFPVEDPVEVGLHAIGSIERSIYPGAYSEGTAIRFESFDLWE